MVVTSSLTFRSPSLGGRFGRTNAFLSGGCELRGGSCAPKGVIVMNMTRGQLLARCLPILEAAEEGSPVEDSFVELKSALPQDAKAARAIAGSANAAAGEPVIWLVGVDEKRHEVIGASKDELSTWYPRLEHHFDGPPPRLSIVENIPIRNRVVVAMVFETSEAPYVLQRGSDSRDIPWREGNRTVSAHRADLLRILAPAFTIPVPRVDVVSARFRVERDRGNRVSRTILFVDLYVKPASDGTVVFPRHDCTVSIRRNTASDAPLMADEVWLIESKAESGEVPADLSFTRPGPCVLMAFFDSTFVMDGEEAMVSITLCPVGAPQPVTIKETLALATSAALPERRPSPRKATCF